MKPYPTASNNFYLENVGIGMDPILEIGQLPKFWHFEFLPKFNFIRIVLQRCIQSPWSYLAIMSNSHNLCLEQILLSLHERRRRHNWPVQLPSQYLLDVPRASDLLGRDKRKFHPLALYYHKPIKYIYSE